MKKKKKKLQYGCKWRRKQTHYLDFILQPLKLGSRGILVLRKNRWSRKGVSPHQRRLRFPIVVLNRRRRWRRRRRRWLPWVEAGNVPTPTVSLFSHYSFSSQISFLSKFETRKRKGNERNIIQIIYLEINKMSFMVVIIISGYVPFCFSFGLWWKWMEGEGVVFGLGPLGVTRRCRFEEWVRETVWFHFIVLGFSGSHNILRFLFFHASLSPINCSMFFLWSWVFRR